MKTVKKVTAIALATMTAFIFAGCSQDAGDSPAPHEHVFAAEWTCSETYHWHGATCEHTDQVKDKANHDFPETWGSVAVATEEADGLEERFCSVCDYRETRTIPMLNHNHNVDRNNWSYDETNHWHKADCGRPVHNEDVAPHTEDNGTVTAVPTCTEKGVMTYKCTVCDKVLRTVEMPATGHKEDSGSVTTAPTCVTKGVRTYKCSVCKVVLRTEELPELYSSPVDATTGKSATSSSTYIYFGVFPKTVLATNSKVTVNETISVRMGTNTYYYKGSNGEYYAKVRENACETGYRYSDGTQVKDSSVDSYRYFKVEPIKWKVIYSYSGKYLLLAENILTADVPYYKYNSSSNNRTDGLYSRIYPNNYKYSQIRAYLNGLEYYYDQFSSSTVKKTDYTDNGFLQVAFTNEAQNLIAITTVDNSAASTGYSRTPYACLDTNDKIFLLSKRQITNYGISDTVDFKISTDFAKANKAYQKTTSYGTSGYWWLRSPHYNSNGGGDDHYIAQRMSYAGGVNRSCDVSATSTGVVPALYLELQ